MSPPRVRRPVPARPPGFDPEWAGGPKRTRRFVPTWSRSLSQSDPAARAMTGEIDALRSRLEIFDGAMPAVHLDPALVRPSRWSNRHESVFSSLAFERLLDNVYLAGGNETPILVRQVDSAYEIVFGHRRHRACSELGLPVFAVVWVGPMSDLDHFLAMERENRGREDLSPFDQIGRASCRERVYSSV